MVNGRYKILAVNPGSTSTKVALFENEEKVFSGSVSHNAEELSRFAHISDQLGYRKTAIDKMLYDGKADLTG